MKNITLLYVLLSLVFAQSYDVLIGVDNLNESEGTFDIRMNNFSPVGGFQIVFDSGTTVVSATGGSAASAGLLVQAAGNQILGFSLTGGAIPAGDAVLANIS